MSSRNPRVVVVSLATAILALSVTQVAFGASAVTTAWQAKVGASGVNGTAKMAVVTTGAGTISLNLIKLRASTSLPVTVNNGTCGRVGSVLFPLASIRTTSAGRASRTNSLTTAQVKLILKAKASGGKIVIRVGSGSAIRCGAFTGRAAPGPQVVVQTFYDYYLTDASFQDLVGRSDLTSGFVRWLLHFSGPANPIVCAQDNPPSFTAGSATISGSSATVKVTSDFGKPTVKLTLSSTGWRISAVDCGF